MQLYNRQLSLLWRHEKSPKSTKFNQIWLRRVLTARRKQVGIEITALDRVVRLGWVRLGWGKSTCTRNNARLTLTFYSTCLLFNSFYILLLRAFTQCLPRDGVKCI